MKKIAISAIAVLLVISAGVCGEKAPVPARTSSWVNDYAGIIDVSTKRYLEGYISNIKQKTPEPVEIIIATFPLIEGWEIADFAAAYGEKWREAKKGQRDNGVVLLVVTGERKIFIGVGQNLKGILTEAVVNDLVNNIILPEFSNGNFAGGIKKGVEKIADILAKAQIPTANFLLIRLIVIGFLIAAARLIIWHVSYAKKSKENSDVLFPKGKD